MKRRRGFSLLEVMFVIALVTLLVVLGFVSTRKTQEKARSRGLAERIVSELTAARQAALTHQHPVAVVFPSQSGNTPLGQSLYWVEGSSEPRVTRRVSMAQEFPEHYLFVGLWPLTSGSAAATRPATGRDTDWKVDDWLQAAGLSSDYTFVFTPVGTVQTNDLPLFDGEYHLAVGSRPSYASASLSPSGLVTARPRYYSLTGLTDSFSICLAVTGEARTQAGLARSSLGEGSAGPAVAGSLPPPPSLSTVPQITSVKLHPDTQAGASGTQGTIGPDGFLTVSVEATDSDGDALYCQWTSDGGNFTNPAPSPMTYNQQDKVWRSTWTFAGDPHSLTGTVYHLNCQVWDEHNHLATVNATASALPNLEFKRHPRVVFAQRPVRNLFVAGPDGTDEQQIAMDTLAADSPCQTPDGNSVVFESGGSLYFVNLDGSGLTKLADNCHNAVFSPDGARIAYVDGGRLKLMPSGGLPPVGPGPLVLTPATLSVTSRPPSWSSDGKRLAITAGPDSGHQAVYVVNMTDGFETNPSLITVRQMSDMYTNGTPFAGFRPVEPPDPPSGPPSPPPALGNLTLLCCNPEEDRYGRLFLLDDTGTNIFPATNRRDLGRIGGSNATVDLGQGMNGSSSISFSRDGNQVSFGYSSLSAGQFDGSNVSGGHGLSTSIDTALGSW